MKAIASIFIFFALLMAASAFAAPAVSQCANIESQRASLSVAQVQTLEAREYLIAKYYSDIDAKKIMDVMDIFAEPSSYQRDSVIYKNKAEITLFYLRKRNLTGKHSIRKMSTAGDAVFVNGVFEGTSGDKYIYTKFSDMWVFDENSNLVKFRQSWIETSGI